MGRTYCVVCDECKVALSVGQDFAGRSPESFFLYGGDRAFPRGAETHHPFAEFLITHKQHPLRFMTSEAVCDDTDYVFLQDKPGLPPDPPWKEDN